VNNTAASAAKLAKCILLRACSHIIASSQLCENKQNLHKLITYLTSWHNSIFGEKLRID